MKRLLCAFALLLSQVPGALALDATSIPPKFGLSWASSAGAAYIRSIPATSQIGIQNCAASLPDGFPPLTFTPANAGGCPPFGQDFNGILKQLSQWNQWQAAGGPVFYDSAFSTAIGGYPKGAIIQSILVIGRLWYSTVNNNTTDPDTTANNLTSWIVLPGLAQPGTPIPSFGSTPPPNSVSANGRTVGNGSSNATSRANNDTFWLFVSLWTNCSQCTLFNSSGGVIARGATAVADFTANDAIATLNMNGLGLMGADSQGGTTSTFLSGVPVTSGSRTAPTSILGENLHALVTAELAAHTHSITDPGHAHGGIPTDSGVQANAPPGGHIFNGTGGSTASSPTGITATNSTGSGTAHNTVERSAIVNWNLAL